MIAIIEIILLQIIKYQLLTTWNGSVPQKWTAVVAINILWQIVVKRVVEQLFETGFVDYLIIYWHSCNLINIYDTMDVLKCLLLFI